MLISVSELKLQHGRALRAAAGYHASSRQTRLEREANDLAITRAEEKQFRP